MAEEKLRYSLDRAFDAGPDFPDRLLISRTMSALDRAEPGVQRRARFRLKRSYKPMGVLAAALVAALLLGASATFLALSDFVHRVAPAGQSHARPAATVATVVGLAVYSANDAAVWGATSLTTRNPLDAGGLLVTHDGGRTWLATGVDSTNADQPQGPISISWTDSRHLTVVDYNGLRTTSDGGVTWHDVVRPVPVPTPSVQSIDATVRVSGTAIFWIANPDQVYVTLDGGATWTHSVLPAPAGGWPTDGYFQVAGSFMFGQHGVLGLEWASNTLIYTTPDGGATWSGPLTQRGQSLIARSANEWWIVKSGGHVSRTVDGGHSWTQMPITPNYSVITLTSVFPAGGNVLWAIANSALPLRSTDGGLDWSLVKLP